MPTREEEDLAARAHALLEGGRPAEAERLYQRLIEKHHVLDAEYDDWLHGAAECYRLLRRYRDCGLIYLFLHAFDRARDYLPQDSARFELGVCAELERNHAEAARLYATAGRWVLAALSFERAGDLDAAYTTWQRVAADPRLRGATYERALVQTNLGLSAQRLRRAEEATQHLVQAQQHLEEAADAFETAGERDRAFYCYQVLIELGKTAGSFENLAEGYLNCIRVMKQDNLRFYVLQYYEDFLRLAFERQELHAAATLAREAADYALRASLPYDRHYLARSGELWQQCAEDNETQGRPPELGENALLAAIESWSTVGDFGGVGRCYERLATLALPEKKRRRYARVAERYRAVARAVLDAPAFPDALRRPHAYADVWHLDLVEWELDGDYVAVCTTILGDLRYPDPFRRRALALALQSPPAAHDGPGWARVGIALGSVQLYAVLRPLERLFESPEPVVRAAVLRGLSQMFYKRSFGVLQKGLADADEQVREAALDALAKLHFPHAFDALVRIFQQSQDERVKVAALSSIGELQVIEAGEFLVDVVRHESEALVRVAQRALAQFQNADIVPILRGHIESESGSARVALEQVLRRVRRPEAR